MKVVIDTNIIFSAILNSNSGIGQIILMSGNSVKFYSPKFLQTEIKNNSKKIKKYTGLTDTEIDELINIIYTKINFISEEIIPEEILATADTLTKDVDYNDVMFVALSLFLDCKLWTGDKTLINGLNQKGFSNFISTQDLKDILL